MFSGDSVCTVEAHAKINLTLEVLGRRADGYHDLRSILVPVALADSIRVERKGTSIDVHVRAAPGIDLGAIGPVEQNLAWRAARLLQERYGAPVGLRIDILKRIPIGGGLGGGSADAAGVLRAVCRLAQLRVPESTMLALAAELGSDVPALLHGGAVCMEGRGDRVTPVLDAGADAAPFWLVLANPGISVSTSHAYQLCRLSGGLTANPEAFKNTRSSVRRGDVHGAAAALFNGLEQKVFEAYPETASLAARLKSAGSLGVLLSGSGASVFALVSGKAHGEDVRRLLGAGVWSVVTQTLPDGVMAAHGPLEP